MDLTANNFSARIHELLNDQTMRECARVLGLRIAARPPLRHASRLLTYPAYHPRPSILPAKTIST
jgi:hypothetical protein